MPCHVCCCHNIIHVRLVFPIAIQRSDNLPEDVITVEGDRKTIVSYKAEDGKVKKVVVVFKE